MSGSKQGLPSSNSEISLSQTPPPANGLSREYGRQGNMPLSGSMDNMQGDQGFYQVPPGCVEVTHTFVNRWFAIIMRFIGATFIIYHCRFVWFFSRHFFSTSNLLFVEPDV